MIPKISIILPVYNSEMFVTKAIQSVLSQTLKDFELIIIDDGSTDQSYSICSQMAQIDSRIRLYRQKNGGICEARNFGLSKAQGEYISFLDHDDIILPYLLEENYNLAIKYKADIIKFGREYIYIKDSQIISTSIIKRHFIVLRNNLSIKRILKLRFNNTFDLVWDGLYKREVISKNEIKFDPIFKSGGEDIDFCSKFISKANTLIINPKTYYKHFIRKGFSTSTKASTSIIIAAKEHPLRLYYNINSWDKNIKKLFVACFVKECLALIAKTYYELSLDKKEFTKNIQASFYEIKTAPYFNIIQEHKFLYTPTYNIQNIYYKILFILFKKNSIDSIYHLLQWRYSYRHSM